MLVIMPPTPALGFIHNANKAVKDQTDIAIFLSPKSSIRGPIQSQILDPFVRVTDGWALSQGLGLKSDQKLTGYPSSLLSNAVVCMTKVCHD